MEERERFFTEPFEEQPQTAQNGLLQNDGQNEKDSNEQNHNDALDGLSDPVNQYAPQVALQNAQEDQSNANENEEFASEVAPSPKESLDQVDQRETDSVEKQDELPDMTWGWTGLALAIASLFFWPAIFGPAAAIVGFIAFQKGNRALGIASIILGLTALFTYGMLLRIYS